jgi:hypothetical protein
MFPFSKDSESDAFLREIAELIEILGQKSADEAFQMMGLYWKGVNDIRQKELRRETPYHWAMCILHPATGDKEWYHDQRFWPPPEWICRKYYSDK